MVSEGVRWSDTSEVLGMCRCVRWWYTSEVLGGCRCARWSRVVPEVLTTAQEPTFNLLGEADSLRVGQSLGLLVDVADVQDFTHELNDRLGFVEGCGGH